jgi:hypothetical protein
MTYSIDELFAMLSWNSTEEIQKIGLAEARKVKHLSVLLQPIESKSVWENCAKVFVEKSDLELERYLVDLFKWLQDMNWPGAVLIYDRLKELPKDLVQFAYKVSLDQATCTGDEDWKETLIEFMKEIDQ